MTKAGQTKINNNTSLHDPNKLKQSDTVFIHIWLAIVLPTQWEREKNTIYVLIFMHLFLL